MKWQAHGVAFQVHPALVLMGAVALWLGEGETLIAFAPALLLHEAAHLAAAHILGIRVESIELMPFGAAVRMENLWRIRAGQLAAVALAGPAMNLAILLSCAALAWARVLPDAWAVLCIKANASILLFNLLPALPLDGGRALFGALNRPRAGVWAGRALACALCVLCVAGIVWQRRVNLTFLFCAAYLFASGEKELAQAQSAPLMSLYSRWGELCRKDALPVRAVAVPADILAVQALGQLRARRVHLLCVFDANMRLLGTLDEAALRRWLEGDGQATATSALRRERAARDGEFFSPLRTQ